jgi:thiosulfate/3-mercaptopyruvate sulfurtransferase
VIERFGPLVSGDWLARHHADVRVVDVRWYLNDPAGRTGREEYLAAHIPGAVFLDVDTDLAAPASAAAGRHPLPTPEHFARVLGVAGIAAGQPVVAYDDAGGSVAARLWWMLHVLGEPVAVLDGGLAAWPGELTAEMPRVHPVVREPRDWPTDRFVEASDVLAAVRAGSPVVVDARTAQRYAVGDPAIDPRPGHIPGAESRPWADNLDPETGRFRTPEQLRHLYRTDLAVIAYCGSGVTSCHDLLAAELAGAPACALYVGSWSQWGADPALPAEVGDGRPDTDPARLPGSAPSAP